LRFIETLKSEIRISKSETNSNFQNPNVLNLLVLNPALAGKFGDLILFRYSPAYAEAASRRQVLRISDFSF